MTLGEHCYNSFVRSIKTFDPAAAAAMLPAWEHLSDALTATWEEVARAGVTAYLQEQLRAFDPQPDDECRYAYTCPKCQRAFFANVQMDCELICPECEQEIAGSN